MPLWPSYIFYGPANSIFPLLQRVERLNSLLFPWAHTRWLICSGVLIVFSSPYLQPLRTCLKIITKAANPDLQIRKYSLIYELYKLGITNETSSLITGYSPPAHLSPLAPCGQLRNPVRDEITATQPHSPWQLGSWHWTLAPRPATEPHCLAVSIDVMSSQMQSWSLKCFWWNPIPENHLESLHWWGLCRHLSIFWELFFKCGETLGFTQLQIQNERWDLAYGLQIGQALLLPVPMGIEEISAPPCSLHHYSH